MVVEILQVIGLALFASVKFLFAPSTVYLSGYNYFETIAITTAGGAFGVFTFFYGGSFMFQWINDRFPPRKTRKSFTKKNRILIRVKNSYGIYGLALLSPSLISIPFGCIIAAKYYRHDRRTLPAFFIAVFFWSLVLTSATALIGIQL